MVKKIDCKSSKSIKIACEWVLGFPKLTFVT